MLPAIFFATKIFAGDLYELSDVNSTMLRVSSRHGIFLSMNTSIIEIGDKIESLQLSLYLDKVNGYTPVYGWFVIYPASRISSSKVMVENRGFVTKVPITLENYINFALPRDLFGDLTGITGFFIKTIEDDTEFLFRSADASTNSPILEIGSSNNINGEFLNIPYYDEDAFKDFLVRKQMEIKNQTAPKFYDSHLWNLLVGPSVGWMVGFIMGLLFMKMRGCFK